MSGRTLLLGYDLGDEKTRLAVYNRELREPEIIGQTEEEPDFLCDTAIRLKGHEPIYGFLDKIRRGEDIVVDGKVSNPVKALAYYFRKTLTATKKKYPTETIRQLVVTVEGQSAEFAQVIYDALAQLGIGKERAVVMGHRQCFPYFVLSQKKELWVNDVGMFDYSVTGLKYYQMQVDRRKTPIPVRVLEKDYTDAIEGLAGDEAQRSVVFENVVYSAIHKQILSTLYMTGTGFEGEWSEELFRKICVGRRLFKGNNLYVYGACYAARELGEAGKLENYLMMDDDMIEHHLALDIYGQAEEKEIIIAKAGTPWYQIDETVEVIPDGEKEIVLKVVNIFTKDTRQFILSLEPVLGKVNRQCRLAIRVRFSDVKTCVVTMKDIGFGQLFPTSNRIWERALDIG